MIKRKKDNSLHYCCWILSKIAYDTNNYFYDIVNMINNSYLEDLYRDSSYMIFSNPDKVEEEIISEFKINKGNFNRGKEDPSWDIFCRVVVGLIYELRYRKFYGEDVGVLKILKKIANHPIGKALEDYYNCLYWQCPECIYDCYVANDLSAMDD